jgi:uncharacterized repeat protein (TIGR04138 family)
MSFTSTTPLQSHLPTGWKAAYASMYRDGSADFPPACLHYVLELVRSTSRQHGSELTPAATTRAFREAIRADFGALAGEVLEDWGLRTPKDLGHAVELLGRYGCLTLDSEDTPEHFALDTGSLFEVAP